MQRSEWEVVVAYSSRWTRAFPDLFAGLDEGAVERVSEVLANGHLEGWEPTRSDVADLIDYDQERIGEDEYDRRVRAAADLAAGRVRAVGSA